MTIPRKDACLGGKMLKILKIVGLSVSGVLALILLVYFLLEGMWLPDGNI
jgi:hypothetical protein